MWTARQKCKRYITVGPKAYNYKNMQYYLYIGAIYNIRVGLIHNLSYIYVRDNCSTKFSLGPTCRNYMHRISQTKTEENEHG